MSLSPNIEVAMPFPGLTAGENSAVATPSQGRVRVVNPLEIADWDDQMRHLPGHSFFHTTAWLRVLEETYGFEPCCLVETGRDALLRVPNSQDTQERVPTRYSGVLPLVEVRSRLTGKRGVALPFADFCPPLAVDAQTEQTLIERALALSQERGWKYIEWRGDQRSEVRGQKSEVGPPPSDLRPLPSDLRAPTSALQAPGSPSGSTFDVRRSKLDVRVPSLSFFTHSLDLKPGEERLYHRFEGSVRRAIKKAEQAGVQATVTTSKEAMANFHQLYCLTRQRHGLPPQPYKFFRSIHRHIIARGQGFIVEATHQGRPVASAVYFTCGRQALYKYGASDLSAQELRANNLVMWTAIKALIGQGFASLDFGRTSLDNDGLRRFKKSWGTAEEMLPYYRYDVRQKAYVKQSDQAQGWHTRIFRFLPISLARIVGAVLYKHTA